jgi:hypothetical protein
MAKKAKTTIEIRAEDKATKGIEKIAGSFKQLRGAFFTTGKHLNNLTNSLAKIAAPLGIASGAIIKSFTGGIKNAKDYANTIADLSERLGVNAKFLQEQQYLSKMNAGSAEEMNSALSNLSKQYGALKSGTGKLFATLEKFAPAVLKQMQSAKSTEEAYNIIIRSIRKLEDPSKKLYLAQLAFGDSGKAMVHIANQSEESLEDLKKEANEAGSIMSNETVKAAQDLGDKIVQLRTHINSIFATIMSKLLPVVTPLVKRITEWIKANKALINTKIDAFVKQFTELISKIDPETILNIASSLATGFLNVTNIIAGMNKYVLLAGILLGSGFVCNAFKAIGAIYNLGKVFATFIASFKSFAAIQGVITTLKIFGIQTLVATKALISFCVIAEGKLLATLKAMSASILKFGITLMSTPVGWFIAAITAIAGTAYLIYRNWDKISVFFSSVWINIKSILKVSQEYIKSFAEGFTSPFIAIGKVLANLQIRWSKIWENIKKAFAAPIDFIISKINFVLNSISSFDEIINKFKSAGDWLKNKLYFGNDNAEDIENNEWENRNPWNTGNNASLQAPQSTLQQYYNYNMQANKSKSEVIVKFENMPKEASVEKISHEGKTDLGVEYGYALGSF